MTDMQMSTHIVATATEPEEIFGPALRRTVIDYAPLMVQPFNNTRQGTKHVPSLALGGVVEECQRLTALRQQNEALDSVFDAFRPWDRLFTYSVIDRHAWAWEQHVRELSARRHSGANHLRAFLTPDQHWPGHESVKRTDYSALDAALSSAAFDIETDYATGEVINVWHMGDLTMR